VSRPSPIGEDVQTDLRQTLLTLNEQVKPIHEWLDGQRAYFLGQGYTADEARAMSAAEFVAIFGSQIRGGSE
jgi:hypothetical protein